MNAYDATNNKTKSAIHDAALLATALATEDVDPDESLGVRHGLRGIAPSTRTVHDATQDAAGVVSHRIAEGP